MKTRAVSFIDFYIVLWLVYELQYFIFGDFGTLYSQLLFLFLMASSLFYMIYALLKFKMPSYMKGLSWLLVMFTVYGGLLIASPITIIHSYEIVSKYTYLQSIYISLLPIYPFYVFTRKGKIDKKHLRFWTIVFFIAVTIQYFQNQQLLLLSAEQNGSTKEEFVNNIGYVFLSLIPLLAFFSNKQLIQYIGLSYVIVFVLLSMKRGAIIIGALSVLLFLFLSLKNVSKSRRILVILLGIIVITIGYYVVLRLLESSEFFNIRIEETIEGNSSGRNDLFKGLLTHFLSESNFFRLLFGNGANATLRIIDQYAHNDWLEIAINQGFLGLFIYFSYWLRFYKSLEIAQFDKEVHLALSVLFICFFMRTFFSMSYGDMNIYSTLCLGYSMGRISENALAV